MRCPRCTLAELSETTETCALCGYSPGAAATVETAVLPTELDARRELAREFRIERLLERSPGTIVYLARDAGDQALALKVVPLAQLGAPADRILATIDAAAQLDHAHIVPVHASGTTDNFLWYAARYVEGRSLGRILLTVGSIEVAVCLRIFEQVGSALDYAHRRGVTHGALTAESIIVDANEWVLVGDFGTAGLLESPPVTARAGEQAGAADQHALAGLVQLCFTGTPLGHGPPKTPGNGHPAVPLHVSQALRRALSGRPAERFPNILDFVAALGGGRPEQQRPAWLRSKPRKGPGAPVVIVDADEDPAAAARRGGSRKAAAAGLAVAVAATAAWVGMSSVPAAPASRQGAPSTHAADSPPASAAPAALTAPTAPAAPADTLVPPLPHPRSVPASRAPPPARASRPAAERRAPAPVAPAPVERRAEPAMLSVNAIPWGSVYLDGRPVGNTPQIDIAMPPGPHRLRVEREGFRPYDRIIEVASGQRLRITDIALVER